MVVRKLQFTVDILPEKHAKRGETRYEISFYLRCNMSPQLFVPARITPCFGYSAMNNSRIKARE